MSTVAILGAGPIGAATASRLAERARVDAVCLIDAAGDVAAGKALDIRQSGPIGRADTAVSGDANALTATGASVVVVADDVGEGARTVERGLELVQQLVRAGCAAPMVFASPMHVALMEACARDLEIPAHRLIGSAPTALVSAIQAIAALELNLSAVDLTVVGRPPSFVIGWTAASTGGGRLSDRIPAHRLLSISQSLPKLWPPGPLAIGAATAAVVEALILGSRRLHPAMTIVDGEFGARGAAVLLPLELGRLRVLGRVMPSLSPQEMTALVTSVGRT